MVAIIILIESNNIVKGFGICVKPPHCHIHVIARAKPEAIP
jgi:hypothetical protein